jgi:crotonobetainyl-CoA:carnitine CoA-transferase CaiB-like acyl-CoA transferase
MFDTRTQEGRKAFDEAVAKNLIEVPLSRGDVAHRMGIADVNGLRAVGNALKRGVRDGWSSVTGNGAWAKYARRES